MTRGKGFTYRVWFFTNPYQEVSHVIDDHFIIFVDCRVKTSWAKFVPGGQPLQGIPPYSYIVLPIAVKITQQHTTPFRKSICQMVSEPFFHPPHVQVLFTRTYNGNQLDVITLFSVHLFPLSKFLFLGSTTLRLGIEYQYFMFMVLMQ